MSLLPNDKTALDSLYNDLKRGTGILDDEAHLNMYLRSFGKMHQAKLNTAFDCLPDLPSIFQEELEVYDWGCGQGTASICLLDYLKKNRIAHNIKSMSLIDPSSHATRRAKDVIECYGISFQIHQINKGFDDLETADFEISNCKKLHLFSNILDVEGFDLARFTLLFQNLFSGDNHFVCVGPFYSNNRRVDDFIAAIAPDEMFATFSKQRGEWKGEWTISLRVFFKDFNRIESIENIRKRIEESHKKDQFFAGYILDAITEEYGKSEIAKETEGLFNALSSFDVKSNKSLDIPAECDSKLAVLSNIVSRGLPTKAPLLLEEKFSDLFNISDAPAPDSIVQYHTAHRISKNEIFEALHIIDPRFDADFYNGDMLESSFEHRFIESYINGTDSQYLMQILEPQRPLSSIVSIPDRQFSKDQRVDFAIEIPYGNAKTGFVFELDGRAFHSNIFQKLRDEKRDKFSSRSGWDTYRLEHLNDFSFLQNWQEEEETNRYLSIIKRNSKKHIEGKWRDTLQVVLSPLAVARVEKVLLQAIITGNLKLSDGTWNIIVMERDVPCAALAIAHFKESFEKLSELDGSNVSVPHINLTIVSTDEFKDSPLHLGHTVDSSAPRSKFDVCIDVSMLIRDNIDALPLNVDADTLYLIRSSHYKKKERTICSAENIIYPTFVSKDTTGAYVPIPEREECLTYFLKEIFRKPSFRSGQLPILSRSLSDKTTIGLLPTGGGKSLTYQLSSLLQPGVTIVVDPLVSLMVDQVRGLHELRIDASDCVNSGMDGRTKAQKLNLLQNGSLLFMLLSPERYMMENFRDSLVAMTEKNHIYFSYGVIDEVHCVSEWGHDFRTSYLHLGRNMINFMKTKSKRPLSIIGLTATASFDVLADVERELTLGGNLTIDSETIVRPENDTRPELIYRVVNVEVNYDSLRDQFDPHILNAKSDWDLKDAVADCKKQVMYDLVREVPADIEVINNNDTDDASCHICEYDANVFHDPDTNAKYNNAGILFCPHAHGTFGVQDNEWGTREGISKGLLAQCGDVLKIGTFVGGDKPSGDMKSFNENDLNMMVATKAFRMGIDKPNIRYTIHLNHPASIESYVQEAGRGGRDKKHAISYVLYDPTEYINLTIDKINDIRVEVGRSYDTDIPWLESYSNKFILRADFTAFLLAHNCTEDVVKGIVSFCKEQKYFENIDKGINLWFHNNSFRGLYKEKVILYEMTDRILNVKPSYILEVQGKAIDETGNSDLLLKLDASRNALKVLSQENSQNQYGYIFLDTLTPTYNYINFDYATCSNVCTAIVEILRTYDDYSARALLRPIEGQDNAAEGIYSAMAKANEDGYVYVTVTWENQIQQDFEEFEQSIKAEITRIAGLVDDSIGKKQWRDIDANRYGNLNLRKVSDFEDLIAQIAKYSNDSSWLRFHNFDKIYGKLKMLFCQKRDKDDTDKAIYRMCCIGLVEDVTIDYLSQTYELKIKRRDDSQFKQFMLDFFRKYYSLEQSQKKVDEIDKQQGRNYLDKCLGYLTKFVYENLEKKRYRAIEDMRIACEDSISNRDASGTDEWLKEFIHLYFNSKYARHDYEVAGEAYSLSKDTDEDGREDFDVVRKYIRIITDDPSGSEIDNVKHLYGATLLCLRAHPENAALKLLLTYCITFLKAGNNETLKNNAVNGYIEGFMSMFSQDKKNFWKYVDEYNEVLSLKAEEEFIRNAIIRDGKETLMLLIHENEFNKITSKYTK